MSGTSTGSRVTAIWPTAPSPRRNRVVRSSADWLSSALSVARAENSSALSSYSKIVPPSVPESWTARPTIVVRTVSRSSEELTARPTDRPDRLIATQQREGHHASEAANASYALGKPRVAGGVHDVDRRPIADGLGVVFRGVNRHREACPLGGVAGGVGTRHRGEDDLIALDLSERARVPPEQPNGARQDRVEHRPDIGL